MKYSLKYILVFSVSLYLFNCNNVKNGEIDQSISKVLIKNKEYDFGKATINDTIKYTYLIKNISDNPYFINKVGTSCGCTSTNFTKTKVLKGEFAKIEVVYIPSTDDLDIISKSIVVSDNSEDSFCTLYLKGKIIK